MFSIRKIQEKSLFPIYVHKATCNAIRSQCAHYLWHLLIFAASHTSLDFGIFGEVGKYSGRDGKIRTGSVYECCKTILICRVRATSNTYPTVSIDKRRPDSYTDYHSCLMSPCMQSGPFLGKKIQR